jgi:hypothetical protein
MACALALTATIPILKAPDIPSARRQQGLTTANDVDQRQRKPTLGLE